MKIIYISTFLFSLIIASDLDDWLKEKSLLINDQEFSIRFNYSVKEKNSNSYNINQGYGEYYFINSDSSIIKLDNRITLCYGKNWEVIDIDSKQKFLQGKDKILQEYIDRLLSIFFTDDYKVIKLIHDNYILSLNDYFFIMSINFNSKENDVSKISFNQNSYLIEITNLSISLLDSIPYQYQNWENFDTFNLR